jgi:epoxyqueuosine reductase
MTLAAEIKKQAGGLGFDLVGVASVEPSAHIDLFRSWVEGGAQGDMSYLSREDALARRADLKLTLPSLKAAVLVGHDYYQEDAVDVPEDPARAVVARYARGRDYHDVIEHRLLMLHRWIEDHVDQSVVARVYVDTGPILERELAVRAGLGWFGKNTMLINPKRGSYFFLGVLLLDLDLEPDEPFSEDHCGTCRSCLDACPTDALLGRDADGAPVMDARRCISYLTIEHRGSIPVELRPLMGNRVYGCDICQEVCPWNEKFAEVSGEEAYSSGSDLDGPKLVELGERLLGMSGKGFLREFSGSPVSRARRKGLLRNVCVALGNWGEEAAGPTLVSALSDSAALVRMHAAWALGRIGSSAAPAALRARAELEKDGGVLEEISAALGS